MSAEVRQAIADAVETVEDLVCSPYFQQVTEPGTALVRLDRWNRADNGFGFVATWQVVLLLPADYASAELFVEEYAPALVEALSSEVVVTTVTPSQIILEQGAAVPVLLVEGTREEEL